MISTATRIKLKRSGVAGRTPTLADLQLGEIGINYNDGKLFFRQENDGVGARIIEPGQGSVVGKTIFVTVEGNDNNSGLNVNDAVRSIKKAAELAQYGDGIKVYPGQYIEDNPIVFRDLVAVEGMDLRNVLVTPANPDKDLYLVGDGFHATNHSFVSNVDSRDGAAIISFRPLEGTASDRYFDAARLIRDNLEFISQEAVGFITSGYSGFAAGQRSQDGSRAIELNTKFIVEEAFQFINSLDYTGPAYVNPDLNQCRSDLKDILAGWRYDLISDGNSETTGVGLTYYAPVKFINTAKVTDLEYDSKTGLVVIETNIDTQSKIGDEIKLSNIRLDCAPYNNEFLIQNFIYDNETGIGTVTLPFIHDIEVGDTIKLDGLKFECPAYGAQEFDVADFDYDQLTGSSKVRIKGDAHGLKVGDTIELRNLQFDCPAYGGLFANVANLSYNNISGQGIITFDENVNLIPGDSILLYNIKMTCPSYGNDISVTNFTYDNISGQSRVTTASPHGSKPGDLVKLSDLQFDCQSYLDQAYFVKDFLYDNNTGESLITLKDDHSITPGEVVTMDGLVFQCASYVPNRSPILGFRYEESTGISTVTTDGAHNLSLGERVLLEDLVFSCNSYSFTDIAVTAAPYDNVTGFLTINLASPHGSDVGQIVKLEGLEYSCINSGITTSFFPDGTIGDEFEILDTPTSTRLIINVGPSDIEHTYVGGGTATVGITTTVFPDGTQGFEFEVSNILSASRFEVNVGVSTIAHSYVSGGNVLSGFTTSVFPDGTQGFDYTVQSVPDSNQIIVNVGVSSIAHTYVNSVSVYVDSFNVVTGFEYDNVVGTGLVSLDSPHNLLPGDSFILEDLKFSCDSYRVGAASTIRINRFDYNNLTGISVVTTATLHRLSIGDVIGLDGIRFACPGGSGITTNIFPDGTIDNFYTVLSIPTPNKLIVNVGVSSIEHDYVSSGAIQVGLTTNIFPDGTRPSGNFFKVVSVPSDNQVVTNVGVSTISHQYATGGKFYTGITTNIFPQVFPDPNVRVTNAVYTNTTGQVVITTGTAHGLSNGNPVLLEGLQFTCTSGGVGGSGGSLIFPRNQEVYTVSTVLDPFRYICNIGPSAFEHTYVQGGTSTSQNVDNAVYNERTGALTVTLNKEHNLEVGDKPSLVDLTFSCASGGNNNSPGTLIFPRPSDEFILATISGTTLTIDVGEFPSLPHTYVSGGSISWSGTTVSVLNATYAEVTGILTVETATALGAPAGATVVMQGLDFTCNSGGTNNAPGRIVFPRLEAPRFFVTQVINKLTYVVEVGTSTLAHTYVSGGFSSLKIRDNDPNLFLVESVPTPTQLILNVGKSAIQHEYVDGGNLSVGITTDIFPDGTRELGNKFEVISTLGSDTAIINIGVSTIQHVYESGGYAQYGDTNERDVINFLYDFRTGISTVTVRGSHDLRVGESVKLANMKFACNSNVGLTTNIFPDGTAPSLNIYEVDRVLSSSQFETNVGNVGFAHTYVSGGSVFTGITTNFFPDGTGGYSYIVDDVPTDNEVVVNVGVSSIEHNYVRGGSLFAGRTNERDIANFNYDFNSGLAILTFKQPEQNLFTGDLVKLKDLEFTCTDSPGITTTVFPDTDNVLFPITQRLNPTQFQLDIGKSDFAHTYVRGTGAAFVGITTDIFPEAATGKLFEVVSTPSPTQVSARIGISSIQHNYVKGGSIFVGINTDIFPGDSEVSPLGDTYAIEGITPDGELVINVGTSSITHFYVSGGELQYGETSGGQLQHITGPGVSEATVAAIDFERQISGYAVNNRPWGSFIVAETARVTDFQYNNVTGFATVFAEGINVENGDTIRLSDIEFRCSDEYAGLTTTFFPDNTRPGGQYFVVDTRIDEDTFIAFVGVSSINHTYSRNGNVYRYAQNVIDVDYEKQTGLARITSPNHGFSTNDYIELRDLKFACPVFVPDYIIENFDYDNLTGLTTVTTTLDNTIEVGDLIKLDGIELECPPYGNDLAVSSFVYDNTTGISVVQTAEPHGLTATPRGTAGITSAIYDNVSGILTVTTANAQNWNKSVEGAEFDGLTFSPSIAGILKEDYIYTIKEVIKQTEISVFIGTSTTPANADDLGTVTRYNRNDIKLVDLQFDCPPYGNELEIIDFIYDNKTGNSLITVDALHGLKIGQSVKLSDIKFQCPPYNNEFNVINAEYDGPTGIITVTTSRPLSNVSIGTTLRLLDLQFDCIDSGPGYEIIIFDFNEPSSRATIHIDIERNDLALNPGQSIKLSGTSYVLDNGSGGVIVVPYPDGRDPSYNIFTVRDVRDSNLVTDGTAVEILLPNLRDPLAVFQNEGLLTIGITTNIYPENVGPEGGFYEVLGLPENNQVVFNVGINTIPHNYIRNGSVFTGVTTNFFPGNAQNSPKGNLYSVIDVPTANQIRVNVGVSSITHIYDDGGLMQVGITTNIFPDGTQGSIFPVVGVADSTSLLVNVGTSTIPHTYVGGGDLLVGITTTFFPGNIQNSPRGSIFTVLGKDNECGADRFTVNVGPSSIPHNYVDGGTVTTGVTTDRFPDGTNGFVFKVVETETDNDFVVNVGPSTISHTYLEGGYLRRVKSDIIDFDYDASSGLATVRAAGHRLNVGDLARLADIKFDCPSYGNDKDINDFVYDNVTGRAFVTTNNDHLLAINDLVKLSDIQLECPPYSQGKDVVGAVYDRVSGIVTVSTLTPHGLAVGEAAKLVDLQFACPQGSGITTTFFPDGTLPSNNLFKVDSTETLNKFSVMVGPSTIQHQYLNSGQVFSGITTNIFPGNAQNSPRGSILRVTDTPSANTFAVEVGVSSIAHKYYRGGTVQTGITTDLFPDGTQGDYFVVTKVQDVNRYQVNVGISSIQHTYNSGGFSSKYATYQSKYPQVLDTSVIRTSGDCRAVVDRVDQLAGIVTSIIINGPGEAPGSIPLTITNAVYNNSNGDLSVTTNLAQTIAVDDLVKIENLIFSCQKSALVHNATYDNVSGNTRITTSTPHGLEVAGKVMLEGLEFSCPGGSLIYPEEPQKQFNVAEVYDEKNFGLILTPSTKKHTYVKGGSTKSVPTDRIFPDNQVFTYTVRTILSPTTFVVNVGPTALSHTYQSGGTVEPGLRRTIADARYDTTTGLFVVTTNEDHYFVANTGVKLNDLSFECRSGGPDNQPGTLNFPDNRPANVVGSTYNNVTGLLSVVTEKPHQLYRDAKVRLEGLQFSCPGGSLIYPSNPERLLRVSKVIDDYRYDVQLKPSTKVHTYVQGGTSDGGAGNYRIQRILNSKQFTIRLAPFNLKHTYVGGGTASSVFTQLELDGVNLRTAKCAEDVGKIYLAVAHDITRGGNWKCVEAAKKYYDAVGQYQFISGGEVNQTVNALDYSLNVVRCVINNVTWGAVPRGYYTTLAQKTQSILPSTQTSVVKFAEPVQVGQDTWEKKFIKDLDYDRFTGIATITTTLAHEFDKYFAIKLADIDMRCANSPLVTTNLFPDGTQGDIFEVLSVINDQPDYTVTEALYENKTGKLEIITSGVRIDIPVGSKVNLSGLRFTCGSSGLPGELSYPADPNIAFDVIARPGNSRLVVQAGVSTIRHTFVPGARRGVAPTMRELPTKFTTHVGTVGFDHTYFSGGTAWRQSPFSVPVQATQIRDVSIQFDPLQNTNSTPNACKNVFSAIENCVGVVTTIVEVGINASGISTTYPGNNGKGVPTKAQIPSQGVGNIVKGPYIRNCTNFVPKSIGMRMDGFDAEPGDEISNGVQGSSNVDSFTQFNPGGIGCSVSNGTYQQLVSIFTICCDQAIVADSGAQLDLTNSNSSFGTFGLVARGIGDAKSKCIDRYTGVVAQEAEIEDDTVIVAGVGNKRPYDGQGIFFGELFREVVRIDVTDGGSGYIDENPPNAFVAEPNGPAGIKAEVSPTVRDGKIVSIEVIANGNQYREKNPTVFIAAPRDEDGRQAEAIAITEPLYFDVDSSTQPEEGTTTIIFKQRLNNTVSVGTTVYFSRLSLQIASSHSFEYIGAGNTIDGARPSQGGVPIKQNEVVKVDGGSIVYTSTDQAGNFNIGDDLVINQFTGTISGRSFDQSVLNKVTPLIIALDS